ncbi:hypothetical protein AUC43_12980 [Hymenobacter sedentarius]|uniref:DUF4393 domain-containing protein n=1 Tax=Hymenobacter sedentarius TaxID=1411621 RepID=A0A0U4CCL2_9BACT|nr:hypothetical protein [Hymenobacter sedentarius]ALW85929.1 hypothetical protein AUC43_12980 [Hymenobacter sedentarius]
MEQKRKDDSKPAIISSRALDNLGAIGASILDVIVGPALQSLTKMAEAFPVVGLAISGGKAIHDINHQLFLRKLALFLQELDKAPAAEIEDFLQELSEDPSYCRKVGEELILVLNRLDSVDKATLLGRIYGAFMQKRIDAEICKRYSSLVDRAHLPDLIAFSRFTGGHSISEPHFSVIEIEGLALIGVVQFPVMTINAEAGMNADAPTHFLSAGLTTVGRGFHELIKHL